MVQCKTAAHDGLRCGPAGFEDRTVKNRDPAAAGHFKKAGTEPKRYLREMPLEDPRDRYMGDVVTAAIFEGVRGRRDRHHQGPRFQGNVKRHRMAGGPDGARFDVPPARRLHRPAHLAGARLQEADAGPYGPPVTVQNVQVAQIRAEDHVILVRGAIMGRPAGLVLVRKSIKKAAKKSREQAHGAWPRAKRWCLRVSGPALVRNRGEQAVHDAVVAHQ